MPVSTFSMLIISAPRIFVKGAIFFARPAMAFGLCLSKILCFRQKYVTLAMPLKSGKVLPTLIGGHAPSGKLRGKVRLLPLGRNRERGDARMTLTEFIALLGLLGGAIYGTFQISWAIFKEIHNKK